LIPSSVQEIKFRSQVVKGQQNKDSPAINASNQIGESINNLRAEIGINQIK
jgi:hypothetical protein